MIIGFRTFYLSPDVTEAERDAWVSDYLARCNAHLGLPTAVTLNAFTPVYQYQDGSGGACAAVDDSFEQVEQAGDPPITATMPDGWGLPPPDGDPTTPDI